MKKKEKQELSKLFLESFTESLIKNSVPKELLGIDALSETPKQTITSNLTKPIGREQNLIGMTPSKIPAPIRMNPFQKKQIDVQKMQSRDQMVPSLMQARDEQSNPTIQRTNPKPPMVLPKREMQTIANPSQLPRQKPLVQELGLTQPNTIPALDKIMPFLHNPGINSIECPGPNKNIILNQRGIIKAVPLKLEEVEINEILEHFSERTKIPLIQGTFKAAVEEFIITAVISDLAGTRFHIERKPSPRGISYH